MDLGKAGNRMDRDTWWLNVYVMMSRPTSLKQCLFVNLPTREELFDDGPPADLQRLLNAQKELARHTHDRVWACASERGMDIAALFD